MVGGFVRKSHYSTAGRVNSPRGGRQMDRALLQTVQTKPQRATTKQRYPCWTKKRVRSTVIEIIAIILLSNY